MRILKKKEKKVIATVLAAVAVMSLTVFAMPKAVRAEGSEAVADKAADTAADTATDTAADTATDTAAADTKEAEANEATTTVDPNAEIKTTLVEEGKSGGYTPKSTGNTLMTVVRETDVTNAPGEDGVVLYTYRAGDAVVVCGQQTKGYMPVIFRGQIGYVDSMNLTSAYVDYKQLAQEIEFVNENSVTQVNADDIVSEPTQSSHVWAIILIIIVVILGAVGVAAAVYAIRKL